MSTECQGGVIVHGLKTGTFIPKEQCSPTICYAVEREDFSIRRSEFSIQDDIFLLVELTCVEVVNTSLRENFYAYVEFSAWNQTDRRPPEALIHQWTNMYRRAMHRWRNMNR